MNKKIFDVFCDNIRQIEDCKGAVLAVSGGPDSMALLNMFLESRKRNIISFPFICATFNHGLRDEADEEVAGVRDFCFLNDIPFYTEKKYIKESLSEGMSLEDHARKERYSFLRKILVNTNCNYLVTAHNADDNFETILLNIIRGCGIEGLKGIQTKYQRSTDDIFVIRPLLNIEKKDLIDYCNENGIMFFTDRSNNDDTFRRNYIRKNIVPLIKKINPSINRSAFNMSQLIKADCDYLNAESEKAYSESIDMPKGLKLAAVKYPDAILSRILRSYAKYILGREIDHIETVSLMRLMLYGKTSDRIKIDDHYFVRTYTHLSAEKDVDTSDEIACQNIIPHLGINDYLGNDLIIEKRSGYKGQLNAVKIIDLKKTIARCRLSGDYIHNAQDMGKLVRKLFINKKIPVKIRELLPVITYEDEIVWVAKIGTNKPYIPDIGEDYYSIKFILKEKE